MYNEELIREVISKICPLHGKHPIIKIRDMGRIDVTTCCEEFLSQLRSIMNAARQTPFEKASPVEIV